MRSVRIGCHLTQTTCYSCNKKYNLYNGVGNCDHCEMVGKLRKKYGHGEESDQMISLVEGQEQYKKLIYHEQTILNHEENRQLKLQSQLTTDNLTFMRWISEEIENDIR